MNDKIELSGDVEILKNGVVVLRKKNLIVQTGKNFLANALLNSSTNPFVAIAIGTGSTAPVVGNTTLQTEIARVAFNTATIANNVLSLSATYGINIGVGELTEAGIFNNATSGGTMLSRITFGGINKTVYDTLIVNWTITVG